MSAVVRFPFRFTRILDAEGRLVDALPPGAQSRDAVVRLYRAMLLTRRFDAKAVSLQRTGRLGTYASALGQEAVGVGLASAMAAEDVLVPSYREGGAMLWRGVRPVELLLYWGGDERGSDYEGPREDFPIAVPVGSQALHAVGAAYAMKLRRERRCSVCVMGDGATSRGDVYEAMNLAGVWQVPTVFVVTNNQWAISVPRTRQTAAETLAQKAVAAGLPGEQVDGNDVLAVHKAVAEAAQAAREGGGPRLIEALTYRLADHTTADDATRYRTDAEVSRHWKAEPVARMRSYLATAQDWTKSEEEALGREIESEIDAAVQAYEETPLPDVAAMFDHLFAELPAELARQRDAAAAAAAAESGAAHG